MQRKLTSYVLPTNQFKKPYDNPPSFGKLFFKDQFELLVLRLNLCLLGKITEYHFPQRFNDCWNGKFVCFHIFQGGALKIFFYVISLIQSVAKMQIHMET